MSKEAYKISLLAFIVTNIFDMQKLKTTFRRTIKLHHLAFLFFIFLFVNTSMAKERIILPEGWRYPTVEELSDEPGRKDSPTKYAKTIADFNGDGNEDEAYLLKSTNYSGEGLLMRLSDKRNGSRWLVLDTIDWGKEYLKVNLSMGIDTVKPGEYKTACGKGYFKCEKGDPEVLKLKRPAIDYFKFGSASSFFFWDDQINQFKRIWISD